MCTKLLIINGDPSDYVTYPSSDDKQQRGIQILQSPSASTLPMVEVFYNNDYVDEQLSATPSPLPQMSPNLPLQQQQELQQQQHQTPKQHPCMTRIQRDLNSPSAAVRLRAIKALKSPTKSAYNNFDVPHDEQSIISAEERRTPPPPPTIQELMRDIIVYVEVRTGEDNRSAGVKKVISALGARVNDKLLRDTTHVIFKDGLLSTYKKAKNWNIPIVSILWIEACKNQRKICDAADFPISNLDRYDNPELYDKMKRHKSMQPDSECNKRVRVKNGGTPKESTPKTAVGLKKSSTLIDGTPTSANNKKTDISHFFKQIGNKHLKQKSNSEETTPAAAAGNVIAESPATQLLNKMNSNCYTPIVTITRKGKPTTDKNKHKSTPVNTAGDGAATPTLRDAKKSLNFSAAHTDGDALKAPATPNTTMPKNRRNQRRRSCTVQHMIEVTTNSISEMCLSQTPQTNVDDALPPPPVTPVTSPPPAAATVASPPRPTAPVGRMTRRRSSLYAAAMTVTATTAFEFDSKKAYHNNFASIEEEQTTTATTKSCDAEVAMINAVKKNGARRRTTYTAQTPDISVVEELEVSKRAPCPSQTNCATQIMEESALGTAAIDVRSEKRKPTSIGDGLRVSSETLPVYTPIPIGFGCSTRLQTEITVTPPPQADSLLEQDQTLITTPTFSSTRLPTRQRRTLFEVTMDIISHRLENINQVARRSISTASQASDPIPSHCALNAERLSAKKTQTLPNLPSQVASKQILDSVKCAETSGIGSDDVKTSSDNSAGTSTVTLTPAASNKKRKLYVPNDSLTLTTPKASSSSSSSSGNGISLTTKRRRTLIPLAMASPLDISATGPTKQSARRRSTMDFESTKTPIHKPSLKHKTSRSPSKAATEGKAQIARGAAAAARTIHLKENAVASGSESGHKTDKPAASAKAQKKLPFLVYTNMHREQIKVIREAVEKLGGFTLEKNVSDLTTHVVSLEPRRTLNLMRALIRGLWILEYKWIVKSLAIGHWDHEEPYEMKDFSRAVEICRAECQAFGKSYKCELFTSLGPFYISSRCGHITQENLKELIVLCGGKLVHDRASAKYLLGDSNQEMEDRAYITPHWILDSITQMQLLKIQKYTVASEPVKPVIVPPASPTPSQQSRNESILSQQM